MEERDSITSQSRSGDVIPLRPEQEDDTGSPGASWHSDFHREWTRLANSGGSRAERLELCFDYCHSMVFSIANRITGSRWDAEDITQNVFEALARRLKKIRDPARIPGFLKTTSVRMSLRHVKRSTWRRGRVKEAAAEESELTRTDEAMKAASVYQLLERLEPEERTAVVLKFVEMHSHEEVASLMGISVSTARRRLDAARNKLAAIVGRERLAKMIGTSTIPGEAS